MMENVMSKEFEFLQKETADQVAVYSACDTTGLPRLKRLLVQAWLSEVGWLVHRLQCLVVRLETGTPSAAALGQSWTVHGQVFTALSPVSQRYFAGRAATGPGFPQIVHAQDSSTPLAADAIRDGLA